jgi:tryptophan 2,3-dioxygenase
MGDDGERPQGDLAQPILPGPGATDYERYLRTDDLLRLQKDPDEMVHRDERLFQTVHQSSELWLKLACFELEGATELLDADDVWGAVRLLRRASHCVVLISDALHALEHMSPWEYRIVRRVLGHGSGFDSPGFRRLRELAPRLHAAFLRTLEREGVTLVEAHVRGRELEGLYQLAEQLIELDERVTIWRMVHVKMVERVIGVGAIGTQGTPVEVLERLTRRVLFPQLWDVRNTLTDLADAEEG